MQQGYSQKARPIVNLSLTAASVKRGGGCADYTAAAAAAAAAAPGLVPRKRDLSPSPESQYYKSARHASFN
jgi:hypothetical protein